MELMKPKFVVLDTSTLARVSQDFVHKTDGAKRKARKFIDELAEKSVHVTLTFTHVCEFLRHQNDAVVKSRLDFLRQLPLLAWLRPYSRDWMPGTAIDLFRYELHQFWHHSKRSWRDIVDAVRDNVFEAATGAEMFVKLPVWDLTRQIAIHGQVSEMEVSALSRSDPTNIKHLTLRQISRMPRRSLFEASRSLPRFAYTLQQQMDRHGDPRLQNAHVAAIGFTQELTQDIRKIAELGGDPVDGILKHFNVPTEMTHPDMTIGELSDIGAFIPHVKKLGRSLEPRAYLKTMDVPIGSLPSYVLTKEIEHLQQTADRVKGSDFGDRLIVPLVLYADAVEVDKRTYDYLSRIVRADRGFVGLVKRFIRSPDYSSIPAQIE